MSTIVVTAFLTLDGVMEAPETWSIPYWNPQIERFKAEELRASGAQLLGRRTYETFADAWPSRGGEYADRLNASEKCVVSTTLTRADWNPARVVGSLDALEADLPQFAVRQRGNLLVHGSCSLVQSLMQRNLVDVYHLLVYPVVRGEGRRLFADGVKTDLTLTRSADMGSGVVLLVYRRREP